MCISVWITCAKRHQACARSVEMLGIRLLGRTDNKASNWVNTIRALCVQGNLKLSTCHAVKAHKLARN
jgi:hypothetical protein